ncbi:MAG TPA: response regulator [Ferruginibacter sp.]|jgi:two-component system response regulator|nr:response regulator [Ferruginibacter sp.]
MHSDQTVDILLIEDNREEAQLTIRSFQKSNLTNGLLHLDDGEAALDFIFARNMYASRTAGNLPKLILLDLKLPKIGGLEILKIIKQDPLTRMIPVVVLTSSREEPDIKACYELGVNSYIVKPVNFESFTKAVAELGMYWMFLNVPPVIRKE